MTETEFKERRDRTLDAIVMARMRERIPGEDEEAEFLRLSAAATLLGRFPMNGLTLPEPASASVPASVPALLIPISPASPVETPLVPPSVTSVAAPGTAHDAGETQEEVTETEPPPAPDEKIEDRSQKTEGGGVHIPGTSGAIYEARMYVLNCLEKKEGVYLRDVMNLTGWERPQAQKFVNDLQDEAMEKDGLRQGRTKPGKVEGDLPSWWSAESPRYCKECRSLIQPRRNGRLQHWQGEQSYREREYCSRDCYQVARIGKTRSSAGATFPEGQEATPAA